MEIRRRVGKLVVIAVLAADGTGLAAALVQARPAPPPLPDLDVQPFPGTPDASPSTDVGFPALSPAEIKSVVVTASRSGPHLGRVIGLPAGHGAAFIPRRPFADGDRVSVHATLRSPGAGTASGAPGATQLAFSFTVTAPIPLATTTSATGEAATAQAAQVPDEYLHLHSEKWLHPPNVWVTGTDPDPEAGDIFADAENSIQSGPVILGPQGRLVYFESLRGARAFNVEVQQYLGQSVLTYWQGIAIGSGHGEILDHHYRQIATVYAGNGYSADAHEFQITPQGDALITVYAPVGADLSSIGGPRHGILMDSIIQEIDIATGKVVWEWHASGHVPLNQSHAGTPGRWPYDFFHIDSIQYLANGNLLVSSRYAWALYEINMRTGRIVLAIDGDRSSFKMGPGTSFEWQHDARMQADGTITVFDNASDGPTTDESQSRALRLRVDLKTRRVSLVHAYANQPPLLSTSQGSVQILHGGDVFVGWGQQPYFSEFARNGRQLWSLHFYPGLESYRGLRFPWWGQPLTPPSVAASAGPGGTRVYASWNGATTVAAWRVLAGPRPRTLTAVGEFRKANFETAIWVYNAQPYVAVQALDATGNVLGTSAAVRR